MTKRKAQSQKADHPDAPAAEQPKIEASAAKDLTPEEREIKCRQIKQDLAEHVEEQKRYEEWFSTLPAPTRQSFADGFKVYAKAIQEHLRVRTKDIKDEYANFWFPINDWARRTREHLGELCPAIGDPPGDDTPGPNWYASFGRLAEYCEKAAMLLERSNPIPEDARGISVIVEKTSRSPSWVRAQVKKGKLTNYGEGKKRPLLISLAEVKELLRAHNPD